MVADNGRQAQAGTLTRRQFVGSAAAASLAAVGPGALRAAEAQLKVRLGLIGCGGRGGWIADLFVKHGGYQVAAVADYFQDRADGVGQKHGVDPKLRFTGLAGYKRLLESGAVDAVAIISPPCFHPEQAEAAVAAGKHVYAAKPIAVDVPGCLRFKAAGKKATDSKLAFLVDFQTRAQPIYQEAVRHVHEGAIGDFVFGDAKYHCGALGPQAEPGTPEARLRNWVFDQALSGDIITEQNIHSLDVMNWILQKPPLHAIGTGGRKVRTNVGNCWDHFALLVQYPDGVGVTFNSKQYNDGGSDAGIICDIYGTKGRICTKYGGTVIVMGESPYRGGQTGQIYQEGAEANIAAFHQQITQGRFDNPTVAPSVQSNLITIMGRLAAYEKRLVTWDETLHSTAVLDLQLDGLKA